jgi:hypothetical protein
MKDTPCAWAVAASSTLHAASPAQINAILWIWIPIALVPLSVRRNVFDFIVEIIIPSSVLTIQVVSRKKVIFFI